MAKMQKKDLGDRNVGPLVIVAAVAVLAIVLGGLWYRFAGPGNTAESLPTKSAKEVPLEKLDPQIRAMFDPTGGSKPATEPPAPR